jgi:hypothetical protein
MVGDQRGEGGAAYHCGGRAYLKTRPAAGQRIRWRDRHYPPWSEIAEVVR